MKVIEHLENAKEPLISFELIPPLRGGNIKSLLSAIDDLASYRPPFIDITSHSAVVEYDETPDGIERRIRRKRPGTLGVCALIQHKYNIDAVPHVLCTGFTREETEDFLIELHYLGIDNVLAIRGDEAGYKKPLQNGRTANRYGSDLIRQISDMNRGELIGGQQSNAQPTSFCIGAAAYPEKHFEAPNLEADVRRTKEKVEAGADYLVTQMFFDNKHYLDYVKACRDAGVEVPIIPGLKILTRRRQLKSIPSTFHCEIPQALAAEVETAKPEHVEEIGVQWALQQTRELLDAGVPSVHFYVMSSSKAINSLMGKLQL
jgi:methylenetetrahydrofolate reductase (NADPH)